MNIESFDPHSAPHWHLVQVHQILVAAELEELPDDQPMSLQQRSVAFKAPVPSHQAVDRRIVVEAGKVLGVSRTIRWPEEDPDNALSVITVHPDHRRRGAGRLLLGDVLARLTAAGVGQVIIDCVEGRPWAEALARYGMTPRLVDRKSRLQLGEVDIELIEGWVARATQRASDYRLVHFQTPVPGRWIEAFCKAHEIMNTAPLEGLEIAERSTTPEKIRSLEAMLQARQEFNLVVAAEHIPSGDLVGYTDVTIQSLKPEQALQVDTGVHPDHRNRGIGRWLKAAMVQKLLAEYPQVTRIDTNNAGSNRPMLAINQELGFREVVTQNAWQGEVATMRKSLGVQVS